MPAADRLPRNARGARSLRGNPLPRLAPPVPARSAVAEYEAQAKAIGVTLIPWQKTAARYLEAQGRNDRPLYREVPIIVGRQNGKTTILKPLIVKRLRAGRRIAHTAQNRDLPREVFVEVAEIMVEKYRAELKGKPRFANGQEEIRTRNGGVYRIVAPTRGGARGPSNDLVIIDELREMDDWSFIDAAKPTTIARPHGQIVYLSNAGTDTSVVLNTLRKRAGYQPDGSVAAPDPNLAYLEWSAAPERATDDHAGWCEANPSIGYLPGLIEGLEAEHIAAVMGETMPGFETEHLCRWQRTLAKPLIQVPLWTGGRGEAGKPERPVLGLALNQSESRASAALAWQTEAGVIVQLVADVSGDPIDLETFGPELARLAASLHVWRVVFDPYSEPLVTYLRRRKERPGSTRLHKVTGEEFATSSTTFVRLLEGHKLTILPTPELGDPVAGELPFVTKRAVAPGVFVAVPAVADHAITATLAVIRAVGAVTGPRPAPANIY